MLGKKKQEELVAIDVGSSSLKLLELDISGGRPKVLSCAVQPTPAESISNNAVSRASNLAEGMKALIEKAGTKTNKVALCVPAPATFTKKVTCNYSSLEDLKENIAFEAGNYIPHKIESVYFDYQVVGQKSETTMDVLIVAVKQDVVEGYLSAASQAGLEPLLIDIDVFSVENMFEVSMPEKLDSTFALVNIGSRYSTVSIIENGVSLFAGDVGVGGKKYTDAISENMQLGTGEAHKAKHGEDIENLDQELLTETLNQTSEFIATELQRQIGFYWSAAEASNSIQAVYVCGGGAQVPGFIDIFREKVGMEVQVIDPCRGLDFGPNVDKSILEEHGPSFGVCTGLALRRLGDKKHSVEA